MIERMDERQTGIGRRLTRRELLGASAIAAMALAACSDDDDEPEAAATTAPTSAPSPTAERQVLAPTPACGDDDDETIEQTEGPFFTPNSPERTSLREAGITGGPLTVTGLVLSTACAPVAGALVDFWQCDDNGEYDNVGYRLRGHQFTRDDGSYTLETIVPGLYTGRTRHIHVKVQAANRPVLTTQLYFPDEPDNQRDGIFDPSLVMSVVQARGETTGRFNFVLDLA
jgi:protocatechuate 3,4-dioxygenase beta subunit